jgi:hypothetical protein
LYTLSGQFFKETLRIVVYSLTALHTFLPICLRTKAANAAAETGVGAKKLWNLKLNLMKTAKYILGVAVALAITASGAFADPGVTNITTLPAVISQPGSYAVHFNNGNAGVVVYGMPAVIQITASDVTLDLKGLTIHTSANGILVGAVDTVTNVHNVTITSGAMDGKTQAPYYGLTIGPGCSNVTVSNVAFTGSFGFNTDDGANSIITGCTFLSPISINSQGVTPPGYSQYSNDQISSNWLAATWPAPYTNAALVDNLGGNNKFTNVVIPKGNVILLPTDTNAGIITPQGTVTGGHN